MKIKYKTFLITKHYALELYFIIQMWVIYVMYSSLVWKVWTFHRFIGNFVNIIQDINELPKSLAYSLRFPGLLRIHSGLNWKTNKLFQNDGYQIEADKGFTKPNYNEEGFLAIQNAVAKTFITKNNQSIHIPEIRTQQFPSPSQIRSFLIAFASWWIPLFILIGFNYTFMNTVRFIVNEKEKQLKESMRIMGLANWMHYLSWFIRTIVIQWISFVPITILLTVTV